MPGVYVMYRVESLAKDVRGAMLTHIASDKQDEMAQKESLIAQTQPKLKEILKDYEKTIVRARDRELYERIAPAFDRFMAAWEKPRGLSRANKPQEALAAFRSETLPAFDEFLKAVTDELEDNKASGDVFAGQATSAGSTGRFSTWAILLLSVVCGSGLAFFIVRGITTVLVRSVSELSQGAEHVASAASQVSSSSQALARRDFGIERRDQLHGPQEHRE
jgi:hypothetical protein